MWRNYLKSLSFPESYISITLGFLVVIVGGLLIYNLLSKPKSGTAPQTENNVTYEEKKPDGENGQQKTELPATHTVAVNETLWSIAEKYYGSGYNWVTIAQENKLTDANRIETGQQLSIPKAEIIRPESERMLSSQTRQPKDYTVTAGDNLWNIAVKEYNDGFAWTKIAQYNNLTNPNLIYVGTALKLP